MQVTINGNIVEIQTAAISYSTVVVLAGKDPTKNISCICHYRGISASLIFGDNITVEPYMFFEVIDTSSS